MLRRLWNKGSKSSLSLVHRRYGSTKVARSLAEAYQKRREITQLELQQHSDLMCQNLMCEKVGLACACRLAVRLGQIPQLELLDVSHNGLDVLPETVFELENLQTLILTGNRLKELSPSVANLKNLRVLDVSNNDLRFLPIEGLSSLPLLEDIRAHGNREELSQSTKDSDLVRKGILKV